MKKIYRRTSSRSFNRSLLQQVGHITWSDNQPAPVRAAQVLQRTMPGISRIVVIPPVREAQA